jgi:hypothetical protein
MVTEVAALLVLIFTMWQWRESIDHPPWMSSALAVLFRDLHEDDSDTGGLLISTSITGPQELRGLSKRNKMNPL